MFAWRAYGEEAGAGPGARLTSHPLEEAGIRVAFTGRLGGVSRGRFASLNLSLVSGDDPSAVLANRRRVLGALGAGLDAWTSGQQIHGARVARIGRAERGAGSDSVATVVAGADALWTSEPGVALAVLTADCLPVMLGGGRRRVLAVVHVGWRGLLAGVIGAAVEAMGGGAGLIALCGPSIGPCCYEVGREVADAAEAQFGPGVMRERNLDLWAGAGAALGSAGVGEIWSAALCTRCERHRFFSHRAGDAGRQGVVACLG